MKWCPAAIMACALLVGCGRYFPPDRNLNRHLGVPELCGTWTLTAEAMALAQRDGFAPPGNIPSEIALSEDFTCRYASPALSGISAGGLSVTGRWSLVHDAAAGRNHNGPKNRVELLLCVGDTTVARALDITERNGRLYLFETWGDPDEWEFMEFERP
jgi:hypothetical protein